MSNDDNDTPRSEREENRLITERREKLAALRAQGNAFPNDFRRNALAADLQARYADADAETETLEADATQFCLAGRMMAKRVMGKAAFTHIQDMSGRIQLFLQRDVLGDAYQAFKGWDMGDYIAARGTMFRTQKGELSLRVSELRLLTKSLRPLPDKWHGLTDTEQRYRQRYVDLIMNPESRAVYLARNRIIRGIRDFFDKRGFVEVETPMLQPIPGGATAKPFITHYNALERDFYLRIAPELYLKRLVVGGFEQVYEINRNFRNEGLSTRHNPEFTMLEFYQAHADYRDLMDLTETLLRELAVAVKGSPQFSSQGVDYDFSQPFARLSVRDSLARYNADFDDARADDAQYLRDYLKGRGVTAEADWGIGKLQIELFELSVEEQLLQPTFITQYPTEVSPLARRSDSNPEVTDRFEMFIGGREIANGFSELNDAEDQAERFRAQVQAKDAGDDEAMFYDADYIRALEYGMPPTAGEGIGIDRLTMLLTDSASIRDVLLFPQMRLEA